MISVACSIKFRKDDGQLASFDNTMFADENHFRIAKHPFFQKLFSTDIVTIQAEVELTQSMELQYSVGTFRFPGVVTWGDFQSMSGEALVFTGAVYKYYEKDLTMSDYTSKYVKFKAVIIASESVVETWTSEPVELVTDDGTYLQIEFFNLENAFHVYYVNPTLANRISHLIRIKGRLRKYKPAGEQSVYDNQNKVIKTKDEVKRILTLETDAIPAYLAEMIVVAVAHDKFFINEIEFVAESKPDYETGGGDLTSLTCALTQRDVIGVNAHDIGFNCDGISNTDIMVLQEENASGQKTFVIPEGYLIGYVTGYRTAGSPTIIAGTTPGGSEVVSGMALNASTNPYETYSVGYPLSLTGDNNLYVTISGAGATATIIVLLLKNRQT